MTVSSKILNTILVITLSHIHTSSVLTFCVHLNGKFALQTDCRVRIPVCSSQGVHALQGPHSNIANGRQIPDAVAVLSMQNAKSFIVLV